MRKLKVLCAILVGTSALGAEKVTPRLWEAMDAAQAGNSTVQALVLLTDQVDVLALDRQLTESKATVQERAYTVITQLQQKAQSTQAGVLHLLHAKTMAELPRYESFWIINAIAVEAMPNTILELSMLPEVAQIDLEEKVELIEPVEKAGAPAILPGNAEPGLKVINAQKMWDLGFNGQGVLVMNLDTGVDGLHPALRARWRGTHVPASYAWFDPLVNTTFPTDIGGHGTHTMGTMAGVDTTTRDTIGVAPRAEWIAGRVATANEIGWSVNHIIAVFQWALNPDGNPSTTDDMPAVINNSWGFTTPGCSSPGDAVLNAVEAAGIATVFAAGNSGPAPGTVVLPARFNFTEMNVFSVGAVSGNIPGLPIAEFSSRGPTTCTSGGNQIKPEVSAPGAYVRSSLPGNAYAYWSGASMATPHVAGAIALLKQAFPNKTGTQLKQMLYETTHDLGTPGEDNSYGMGVIDVYQAYLQNAVGENPRPPRNFSAYSAYTTPTSVSLTWIDPVRLVSGDTLVNFEVQVFRDGSQVATVLPRAQHYVDAGLTDGRKYAYALRAKDLGTNRLSLPAIDTVWSGGSPYPAPPSNLSATYSSSRILLNWSDPTTQSDGTPLDDLSKVFVYRNGNLLDSVLAGVQTYSDTRVAAGNTYRYSLKAIDTETPRHIGDACASVLCYTGLRPDYLVWVGPNTAWLSKASGDSLFEAIAANGESVFLTDSLFEFGTDLSRFKAIFVVLGIYPYHHFLAATAPEATALDGYLLNGGRIYLEGSMCYNYANLPIPSGFGGYNIRPWFSLSPGGRGTSDVSGIIGRDSLALFSFQYAGLNEHMDALQPISSIVIWQNRSNSNVCGVFNRSYGSGRAIGVVPSFGGLVDSGAQVATPTTGAQVRDVPKAVSDERDTAPFLKKFAFRPEMKTASSGDLWGHSSQGLAFVANTKRGLMAAYLQLLETVVSVDEHSSFVPLTYSLQQNYPNPFNPSTKIGFQIADYGLVTLKVYDVLGREVATLVNEVKQPGTYTVQWDASRQASGVYLCRLQTGSFVATRKLVLMQ